MASITKKTHLFFTTSPRTPSKMREEIRLLTDNFSGRVWRGNTKLQAEYFRLLAEADFYEDTGVIELSGKSDEDLALAARDRITRAPKALGFVRLDPISLTEAGDAYINGPRPSEAFTRQLLKFQFPSPNHVDRGHNYWVRPYLELLRLTQELGYLSKDEIAAFVTELIHIDAYEGVKQKIKAFRASVEGIDRNKTNYANTFDDAYTRQIRHIYRKAISSGEIRTRESTDNSFQRFLKNKKANHKDYADAAIRYLRETMLVSMRSSRSSRIYIPEDKREEVAFLLENTDRWPVFSEDRASYESYLFSANIPSLYSDDRQRLINRISSGSEAYSLNDLRELSLESLKDIQSSLVEKRREDLIAGQIRQLENYELVQDIFETYKDIIDRNVLNAPLVMEWNTWRAFVTLDDGDIQANLRFDDTGMPLSTASGNQADIVCRYQDFDLIVEVTLSTGARQYEMEGEPVARHLGRHKQESGKDCYCIFVAPSINEATVAHFFMLHRTHVDFYGGTSKIIPLELGDFEEMLRLAKKASTKPSANSVRRFLERGSQYAAEARSESEWNENIRTLSKEWLGE